MIKQIEQELLIIVTNIINLRLYDNEEVAT